MRLRFRSLYRNIEKQQFYSEWNLIKDNPIMPLGNTTEWDELCCSWGSVVHHEKNKWLMYYSGRNTSKRLQIGLSFSEDGFNWKKYERNPIVSCGSPEDWDADNVYCPVVWKEGKVWNMMYTGTLSNHYQIGLAQSSDGLNWIKSPHNPVFSSSNRSNLNSFGKPETEGWGLLSDDSGYYLLHNSVTKKPREVYVAHSRDLISWKSLSNLPLLASEGNSLQLGYMKYCAWPYKLGKDFVIFSAVSNKRYTKSAIGLWKTRSLVQTDKPEFLGYLTRQTSDWCKKESDTPFVVNNEETGDTLCYFGGRGKHHRWTEGIAYIQSSILEACMHRTRTTKSDMQ
jgi:predicted GH43/DUF377 family glycosyl hydrolase